MTRRFAGVALVLCLLADAPALAHAQTPRMRVDSVLLARDLDGDGKLDYVVRESADTAANAPRPARLAIYVGVKPQTQPPGWASPWVPSYQGDAALARSIRVESNAALLEVDEPADDVLGIHVLLLDRGAIREILSHAVGMDFDSFRLRETQGVITVDATPRNLVIDGKEVGSSRECRKGQHVEVRLRFDRTTRSFVRVTSRCVRSTS